MELYIKQKVFSWGDKFTVKDAGGLDLYTVEGEVFTLGKKLHIYDMQGDEVAYIEQRLFTFLPRYRVFLHGVETAEVIKEFTFLLPSYRAEGLDWDVEGEFLAHEYEIHCNGAFVASISKEWMTWGDSYALHIADDDDALAALAVVLAIDAATESSGASVTLSNN